MRLQSNILNSIIESSTDIPIFYRTNTGIIISDFNMEYILDVELIFFNEIKKNINNKLINDYIDSIKSYLTLMKGKEYLQTNNVYMNKENVYSQIEKVESLDNFNSWL